MTTTPPAGAPAPGDGRLTRHAPAILATVATLLSILALVVALGAYSRVADDPSPAAEPAARSTAPAPTATPTDEVTAGPTDDGLPGSGAPLPSGGAPYLVAKQDIRVTLAGGPTAQRSLDLDQPLVNADDDGTDAVFSTLRGSAELTFMSVRVAEARSPAVTPDDCASSIQLSPTDREVKLSQNLVLCVVTNGVGAVDEPSRARMARVVVNSVGPDNSTTLTITTWEIPR
jgi:hypothetical protein